MSTQHTYRGTVRGASVQFANLPNFPDGLEVDVTIHEVPLTQEKRRKRLQWLFGSCEDEAASLDEFVEWNAQQRKRDRSGSQ